MVVVCSQMLVCIYNSVNLLIDLCVYTTHLHSLCPTFMYFFVSDHHLYSLTLSSTPHPTCSFVSFVFSRMIAMRPGAEQNMMVEVNYRQGRDGITLDTVVQDVYLCASMEFLLTVADIFLKATQQGFDQKPQPKSSTGVGEKKNINSSTTSRESSELTIAI